MNRELQLAKKIVAEALAKGDQAALLINSNGVPGAMVIESNSTVRIYRTKVVGKGNFRVDRDREVFAGVTLIMATSTLHGTVDD